MKILLVVPPFHEEGLEMSSKESIGVCYLSSVLTAKGFDVTILDADLLKLTNQETIQSICCEKYNLIGFSLLEGTIESTVEIIKGIREHGVDAHIALGGYFPTLVTEELFHKLSGIDSVIIGEGEYTLLDLAKSLSDNRDFRDIKGIAYYDKGEVIINEKREAFDLDALPLPSRELLPEVIRRSGVTGVVGSRGCFADCSFCCIGTFNNLSGFPPWRGRSPENIADEIEILKKKCGVDSFSFYDSNFIGPGKNGRLRAYAIAEEIIKRGLDINFALSTRADQIEEDLFSFLKKAGLIEVFIGIESMSQPSLDLYNKGTTVTQNKLAIDILERLEISYRPGFILYEPYITLAQIRENISFLRQLLNNRYCEKYHFLKALRVYRGSPLEKRFLNDGVLIRNGWHNAYKWQDPAVEKFITLVGVLGRKVLPLIERINRLDQKSRNSVNNLLGKWGIDFYEEVLNLIESNNMEDSDKFIDLVMKSDKRIARIGNLFNLL